MRAAASSGVRLAELVATISLGTDLGLGQSMEHILRQTLVSLRMAELLTFDEAEREVAYFSGLLAWVGFHTDAYEQAKWFGDDIALKRGGYRYDMGRPVDMLTFAWHSVGRGRPPLEKLRIWLELPLAVRRHAMVDLCNHWLAADELASRLGLGDPVRRSLRESFERWDGRGFGGARGEEIRLTSRVVCLPTWSPPITGRVGRTLPSRWRGSDQARIRPCARRAVLRERGRRALRSRRAKPMGAGYRCRADACPGDGPLPSSTQRWRR